MSNIYSYLFYITKYSPIIITKIEAKFSRKIHEFTFQYENDNAAGYSSDRVPLQNGDCTWTGYKIATRKFHLHNTK